MNFSEAISQLSKTICQLSSLSKTNSEALIELSESVRIQNTKISELEKEIQQLKSKLK